VVWATEWVYLSQPARLSCSGLTSDVCDACVEGQGYRPWHGGSRLRGRLSDCPAETHQVCGVSARAWPVCVCRHVLTVYAPMQQYLTSACVCALAGCRPWRRAVPTRGELETTRPSPKCQAATHKVRAQLRDVCLRTTCVLVCRCVRCVLTTAVFESAGWSALAGRSPRRDRAKI
jgi:hypothetical protein